MNLISDEKTSTLTQGTDYSVNDRTITLTNPTSLKIQIYRETTTKPLVGWADASVLRAADMTVQSTQLLHISEETMDKVQDGGLAQDTTDGVWDARYNRIKNLLDPSESGDAVTLNYITKNQSSLLNQLTSTGATQNASIVSTGDTQNARLTSTGDTQNSRVTSTGDSYVSKITATGTEQNDKVTATGNTYVASIQSNGDTQNTRVTNTATSYITTMTSLKDATNTKATEASNSAALSKAWAESSSSPDGNSSSKSSKSWASVAEGYKNNASTYATNAATSASDANTYMGNAKTYATNASSSASAASTSAYNAKNYESNASADAANALYRAEAALESATAAAASATAAAESATKAATFNPDTYMPKTEIESTYLSKVDAHQLQRSTKYAVGDIAYDPSLPSYLYLECTMAGTTGVVESDFPSRAGVTFSDGTAAFITKTVCAKEYVDNTLKSYSNTNETQALIDAAIDAISIKPGDVLRFKYNGGTNNALRTAGHLTGANKMVFFTIPLNRPIKATAVTIANATLTVRQGGYIFGNENESTAIPSTATIIALIEAGCISVEIIFKSSIGGINNSPIGITFTGTLTFS